MAETTDETQLLQNFLMNTESERLASFKDWPFNEDCGCVPAKMAAAGFYHCPTDRESDVVRCFMCGKELDGWEPSDDPWEEHKKHSNKCPFLNAKPESEETLSEFLKTERDRQEQRIVRAVELKIKEFLDQAARTKEEMSNLKG
ncbi:Baculoviral IAP repeat-containing protein 5 [Holothuria leucospilota]|uniref:Baculoviral IAP repeat-containing protein 5 n=1 Tax=Holothuria leucospilota TaxID=206669 RepID=A0A9Q1C2X9_HOLLE|nr:Baculoviral IAP repeat-containing protein 5 [Holothuria leucospilota]